jgi:ADP-ribose pyrophosphatase YjhB (NUDIX family)
MKTIIKITITIILTIILMVVSYAAISHFSSKYADESSTISVLVVSIIAAIGALTVVSTLYDLHHQKKADRKISLIENEDNHPLAAFRYCPVCGSSNFIAMQDNAKTCKDCGFNYYINPSAAVAAFIINKEGELLVGRRASDPAKGTLDLPGGFVTLEETGEEAVRRELKEELNLTVTNAKILFTIPNKYRWSGMTIPTLDLFYHCEVADLNQLQPLDDVAETFFIKLDYIHPEDFGLASIRQAVTLFQEGKMIFTS